MNTCLDKCYPCTDKNTRLYSKCAARLGLSATPEDNVKSLAQTRGDKTTPQNDISTRAFEKQKSVAERRERGKESDGVTSENKYSSANLKDAMKRIDDDKWIIYKAGKLFGIPLLTLKDEVSLVKLRRGIPIALVVDIEQDLVNDLEFGFSVNSTTHIAFQLTE
ncbi:hypothetical protein FQA39_LY16352 [Lamprigera yunnana]|nr:hypothetical protein FQA39_LY16352 [Lamprigera yunnana]